MDEKKNNQVKSDILIFWFCLLRSLPSTQTQTSGWKIKLINIVQTLVFCVVLYR